MSALRTAPAAITLALALGVAGCGGSSTSTTRTQRATAVPAAAATATIAPPSQSAAKSKAAVRAVRRPPVRRQPRTKPTPTPHAELTSFQTKLGSAFGTFHRYVYAPFQSGSLVGNAVNRAGSATSAVVHDVVEAKDAASGGTAVRALFASLAALTATTNQLALKLEHGQLDTSDLKAVNGQIASIERDAAAAGVPIKERAPRSAPSGAPVGSES